MERLGSLRTIWPTQSMLAFIVAINVICLVHRRLQRKTRGTPGIGITSRVDPSHVARHTYVQELRRGLVQGARRAGPCGCDDLT